MLSRAVALLCVGLALTSALEEMVMKPRREVDVKHRAHQRFVKLRAEHKKAQEEEAEGVEVGAMSALEEDEPKAQAKSSAVAVAVSFSLRFFSYKSRFVLFLRTVGKNMQR